MSRAYLLAAAEEERKRQQMRVTKRVLKEQSSPLELPDEEFLNLFHLSKTLFKELCTVLKPYLPARQYSNAIPLDIKVTPIINMGLIEWEISYGTFGHSFFPTT